MATDAAVVDAAVLDGAPLDRAPLVAPSGNRGLPILSLAALLEAELDTQHTVTHLATAVDRFTEHHEHHERLPEHATHYRELLPFEHPRAGEQYAFEVDLDACTGCKACVTACHTLNGLEDNELWRTVGLLHGGSEAAPALQTVTTSCHHCLEPSCLSGCPVKAYEKDPQTGIVKHLDDQCIGCQYCTLMCPYDAPKYDRKRGIVRKCDMCSDRLAHGEAPACVSACPNGAIAIRVVEQATVVRASDAQRFLPGSAGPEHTLPSTAYVTRKPVTANLLPADFYTTRPEHAHPSLVAMLTLTQLAVGTLLGSFVLDQIYGRPFASPLAPSLVAATLALLALGASIFHLGRPHLFWRAFLGLRTSWLSREAVAFGLFAQLAALDCLAKVAPALPDFPARGALGSAAPAVSAAAALAGFLGVVCSVMVYVATRRAQWAAAATGIRFFATTVILGAASVFAIGNLTAHGLERPQEGQRLLLWLVLVTTLLELAFAAGALHHIRDRHHSTLKRMATLLLGELRRITALRFALGLAGGVLLPIVILRSGVSPTGAYGSGPEAIAMLAFLLAAETCERILFFRSAPPSRMPGGLR